MAAPHSMYMETVLCLCGYVGMYSCARERMINKSRLQCRFIVYVHMYLFICVCCMYSSLRSVPVRCGEVQPRQELSYPVFVKCFESWAAPRIGWSLDSQERVVRIVAIVHWSSNKLRTCPGSLCGRPSMLHNRLTKGSSPKAWDSAIETWLINYYTIIDHDLCDHC